MYLNTYNYFKYYCYNKMVKSNEPLIIKSVRSAMHSLSTPLVHSTFKCIYFTGFMSSYCCRVLAMPDKAAQSIKQ